MIAIGLGLGHYRCIAWRFHGNICHLLVLFTLYDADKKNEIEVMHCFKPYQSQTAAGPASFLRTGQDDPQFYSRLCTPVFH